MQFLLQPCAPPASAVAPAAYRPSASTWQAFRIRCFVLVPLNPPHPAAGWQALVRLASSAALVVTEDMPVPPDADALQALAAALPPGVQVVAVDAACLLPMRLVRKCYEK